MALIWIAHNFLLLRLWEAELPAELFGAFEADFAASFAAAVSLFAAASPAATAAFASSLEAGGSVEAKVNNWTSEPYFFINLAFFGSRDFHIA